MHEENENFLFYTRIVDVDQDGPYMLMGAIGYLFRDLLEKKITDEILFESLIEFINSSADLQDSEVENILKSETFDVINSALASKLEGRFSDTSIKL